MFQSYLNWYYPVLLSQSYSQDSTNFLLYRFDFEKQKMYLYLHFEKNCNPHSFHSIRRVSNQITREKLIQLAHTLWMSKLRYGLQLCTNLRTFDSETKNCNMKAVQVAQNKLLRLLHDVPFNDRTSTSELIAKTGKFSKTLPIWISGIPVKMSKSYGPEKSPSNDLDGDYELFLFLFYQ